MESSARHLFRRHTARLHGISLIKLVVQTTHLVQRHCGISMAVLSGDTFFGDLLPSARRDVDQHLIELNNKMVTQDGFIATNQIEKITKEWTILSNRTGDIPTFEVFETHNFLVSLLTKLIWEIALCTDKNINNSDDYRVAPFIYIDLLKIMNLLGQIRALISHVTANDYTEPEFTARTIYLVKSLNSRLYKAKHTLDAQVSADGIFMKDFLSKENSFEKAKTVIAMIDARLLGGEAQTTSSEEYFSAASAALSTFYLAILTGTSQLSRNLDDDLRAWIQRESA